MSALLMNEKHGEVPYRVHCRGEKHFEVAFQWRTWDTVLYEMPLPWSKLAIMVEIILSFM